MQLLPVVKFGLVGCTGIAVDFCITWLAKEKLHFNKYISSSIGFCFAVVNNFILNKYFTFQHTAVQIAPQFFKFAVVSFIGLLLSTGILWLLQNKTKLNFYISKLAVVAVVFIWNYNANLLFTFK